MLPLCGSRAGQGVSLRGQAVRPGGPPNRVGRLANCADLHPVRWRSAGGSGPSDQVFPHCNLHTTPD